MFQLGKTDSLPPIVIFVVPRLIRGTLVRAIRRSQSPPLLHSVARSAEQATLVLSALRNRPTRVNDTSSTEVLRRSASFCTSRTIFSSFCGEKFQRERTIERSTRKIKVFRDESYAKSFQNLPQSEIWLDPEEKRSLR